MNLSDLVTDFLHSPHCQSCCSDDFDEMHNLMEAVQISCRSMDRLGKRHPHQRRIPEPVLDDLERAMISTSIQLDQVSSFEGLHALVASATRSIRGAGPLLTYDVALRIGKGFKDLTPEFIYLHAGALQGARRLGVRGKKAMTSDFPVELHVLRPEQIEDFLCIKKNELALI